MLDSLPPARIEGETGPATLALTTEPCDDYDVVMEPPPIDLDRAIGDAVRILFANFSSAREMGSDRLAAVARRAVMATLRQAAYTPVVRIRTFRPEHAAAAIVAGGTLRMAEDGSAIVLHGSYERQRSSAPSVGLAN
jgi:hypothetical protein